jgi:hemoglobin-like flavoprotein
LKDNLWWCECIKTSNFPELKSRNQTEKEQEALLCLMNVFQARKSQKLRYVVGAVSSIQDHHKFLTIPEHQYAHEVENHDFGLEFSNWTLTSKFNAW